MSGPKDSRLVVRVSTSCYSTERGLAVAKRIDILKRHSKGHLSDLLRDDASSVGADQVISRIVNLNEVKDGVYSVIVVGQHTDWETGHIEDWDYKLIPYEHPKETKP